MYISLTLFAIEVQAFDWFCTFGIRTAILYKDLNVHLGVLVNPSK